MSDSLDFLEQEGIQEHDKAVLKNLADMGERLKQLRLAALEAEEKAIAARKAYEHYANTVLSNEMYAMGVDSLSLASGGVLKVKRNFYCKPNKNAADRAHIAKWLRENGGEHLIQHDATVAAESMAMLDKQHIPYVENTTVNTVSLKAFLKDKLGVTTGMQQITMDQIPACMHFQEVNTVELSV